MNGVEPGDAHIDTGEGHTITSWGNPEGIVAIEHIAIAGMAHGTPIDVTGGYGKSAPFMLDVGFSSTLHCARSWGLTPSFEKRSAKSSDILSGSTSISACAAEPQPEASGIQKVIEDALRSAGLMK